MLNTTSSSQLCLPNLKTFQNAWDQTQGSDPLEMDLRGVLIRLLSKNQSAAGGGEDGIAEQHVCTSYAYRTWQLVPRVALPETSDLDELESFSHVRAKNLALVAHADFFCRYALVTLPKIPPVLVQAWCSGGETVSRC